MKGGCPGRALLTPPKKEFDEEYITALALEVGRKIGTASREDTDIKSLSSNKKIDDKEADERKKPDDAR
jgi:hypothetical protein